MRSRSRRLLTLAGFDWGARTANIVGALWPEHCKAMVSVSGYLIGSQVSGKVPLPPQAELQGSGGISTTLRPSAAVRATTTYRHDFAPAHPGSWPSPKWQFDDATFEPKRGRARQTPDHVAITVHNYRWRLALAQGRESALTTSSENRLAAGPLITVPTITLEGDANGAPHLDASAYAKKFSGKYSHRVVSGGIGHDLPQEAPQAFTQAVVDIDSAASS